MSSFDYDCDTGGTGIVEALLIEKADISSFSFAPQKNTISAIALTSGGAVRGIETPKRVLVLNTALKINDGAPNAFTHSGTLTITAIAPRGSSNTALLFGYIIDPMANTPFVLLTKTKLAGSVFMYRVYGLYYGMTATAIDQSSHDNGGWFTIAFATPENVIGEDNLLATMNCIGNYPRQHFN